MAISSCWSSSTLLLALLGHQLRVIHGFSPPVFCAAHANSQNTLIKPSMSISKWNDGYKSEDDEDDDLITKEQFLRDILSPESARRKKKGSKEYKPHDNRDALPFIVKVKTPHPYTKPEDMLEEAKYNSEVAKRGKKSKFGGKKISNLVGMDERYTKDAISASISVRRKDGTLYKVLGQFELDKNTNCGDTIEVGEREFEVVTARSQFKYAGGKRFVMVRKILEVKETTRIEAEAVLSRALDISADDSSLGDGFE